jgi:hypothetical protein
MGCARGAPDTNLSRRLHQRVLVPETPFGGVSVSSHGATIWGFSGSSRATAGARAVSPDGRPNPKARSVFPPPLRLLGRSSG